MLSVQRFTHASIAVLPSLQGIAAIAADQQHLVNAMTKPIIHSGAMFSPCRVWRYQLWRYWDHHGYPEVMFVGLNPSTADATVDDNTVRRCIRFAQAWGYAGMSMMNAYAYRATDPRDMKAANDPIGIENDAALVARSKISDKIVACWGVHCTKERADHICRLLNRPIHCFGTTKAGAPKHPLYLPKTAELSLYWKPKE